MDGTNVALVQLSNAEVCQEIPRIISVQFAEAALDKLEPYIKEMDSSAFVFDYLSAWIPAAGRSEGFSLTATSANQQKKIGRDTICYFCLDGVCPHVGSKSFSSNEGSAGGENFFILLHEDTKWTY